MRFVFVSNYFNHHQKEFSDYMYQKTNGNYFFVATIPVEQERIDMGWQKDGFPPYVIQYSDETEKCVQLIDNADVVIYGDAPYSLITNRLKQNKLTYVYTERLFKKKISLFKILLHIPGYYRSFGRYHNCYLLCASAFTASDFYKEGTFKNKAYKWGYFPKANSYNIDEVIDKKDKTKILWIGRFIDWKHTDYVVRVAKRLKDSGYDFTLDIGGMGVLEPELKEMVKEYNLGDKVTFLGSIPSDKVRGYMENAGIYVFTSDRNEGWGAVLNESMNSGCAVIASHEIGSVPFLMQDNVNGFVYHSGNIDELYEKVKYLLDNPKEQERLGKRAYETIISEWNADTATDRLIELSSRIYKGYDRHNVYKTGPCSDAKIIKDRWYK